MSIEAVLQPRFYYAMSYFSFDAEVLFAFFAFGDTFFTLGLMVHIGLGSDRRRLAGFSGRFSRSLTSRLLSSSSSSFLFFGKIPWNFRRETKIISEISAKVYRIRKKNPESIARKKNKTKNGISFCSFFWSGKKACKLCRSKKRWKISLQELLQ